MTSPLNTPSRRAMLGVALVGLTAAGLLAEQAPRGALVNESPSLPKGLYARRPGVEPGVGSIVAVPQPAWVRPYLGQLGMPPDVLLLKRVAAASGDRVCAAGGRVVLPDRNVEARRRDRQGALLPTWSGCRRLEPGELFLLGDTPGSFDSRYFGPVRADALEGVFTEVMTWR